MSPASDLLFRDQTKISVQVLFQRNDLGEWSLFIFWCGEFWERIIDFLENLLQMSCQWGERGGGAMKIFLSLSGDQVNFVVTIRILRPPTGSCNFLSLKNLLVLIKTPYHVVTSTNIMSIMLTITY